jgi:hypothetical protein
MFRSMVDDLKPFLPLSSAAFNIQFGPAVEARHGRVANRSLHLGSAQAHCGLELLKKHDARVSGITASATFGTFLTASELTCLTRKTCEL